MPQAGQGDTSGLAVVPIAHTSLAALPAVQASRKRTQVLMPLVGAAAAATGF